MKKHFNILRDSTLLILSAVLSFVFTAHAQENFQVKWTMDYTQAGVSSHANFTPANAKLAGGANTYALPSIYATDKAIVAAYIVRPWPAANSGSRYMEFTFTANSFKYNITSIAFRLRRSDTGPKQIRMRTSLDGFTSDLTAASLPNFNIFYPFSQPVTFNNLTESTFSVRIYGYNASHITFGVLWFDEIIINGQVLPIILPVDFTSFKAVSDEGKVKLSWETAWEKNSKSFIVERSSDMKEFFPIAHMDAAGIASGRTQYTFTDNGPLPGTAYYRLRMTDMNNDFSFSKTLDITAFPDQILLAASPNPAAPDRIRLYAPHVDPEFLILTNASGKKIPFHIQADSSNFINLFPLQLLPSGLYVLTYEKNARKEHVKVLVP
ncbi:T9SS type A sorting domain-containing protein [Dyadobacter flavalbus]|uniref:T9SS type A sorting domain-containing protein n=1 Tax=Dyadobacter flavalbus TaxID=2579942 RepID=A0A5M8QVV0_9BACT|nr:T9SS type A sorting domain-containing protein [Dyadobacter flavalbus]KAA6440397.1 T9SS type A sorting domain-containing protein [Dyadobacter flavalbus]